MPLFSLHKIHLKPTHYIAKGRTRTCYQHPYCANQVIKVINAEGGFWQKMRWRWRTRLEIQALGKVAKYPDIAPYFPDFRGRVRTNFGVGFVFNKVHHAVDIYQSQCTLSADQFLLITRLLRRLITLRIPFHMDLTKNVFINEQTRKMYVVDSLGSNTFLPITALPLPSFLYDYFMAGKIQKNIARLWLMKKRQVDIDVER
jgi:hypothetical protein